MSLAFWNNPIVVSAFRIRYRRGGMNATVFYILLLVAGGAVIQHYRAELGGYWPHNYFLALTGLQFFVSAVIAVSSTSASIKAEVTQRTLDFQRIAALSPRQILLGKLLGEPAQAYLLAIATIPLAVFCWLWGGVSIDGFVAIYVQLATTTLMFGAMGLLNRLDGASGKRGRQRGGAEVFVFIFILVCVFATPMIIGFGKSVMSNPRVAAVLGLLTPLPTYLGVVQGDPWMYGLSFFGSDIPFVWVTPIAQLLIAAVCFQIMVRQLVNPLHPALGRGLAYAILVVLDALAAGVLTDPTAGLSLVPRAAVFSVLHLFFSLGLVLAVTPWHETLTSWVWRFRSHQSWLADRWLGNRSPSSLAVLTFAALGVTDLVLFVVLPVVRADGPQQAVDALPVLVWMTVTTVGLTVTYGLLHQWIVFLAGRSGNTLTMTMILPAVVLPHIIGAYYHLHWLMDLSPSYHFGNWLLDTDPFSYPVIMLAIYGLVLVLVWTSLRWRLRRLEEIVDKKLRWMEPSPDGTSPRRRKERKEKKKGRERR